MLNISRGAAPQRLPLRAGGETGPIVLATPNGLEAACAGIARREFRMKLDRLSDGLLIGADDRPDVLSGLLQDAPLWTFGSFLLAHRLDNGAPFTSAAQDDLIAGLNAIARQNSLEGRRYWLTATGPQSALSQQIRRHILSSAALELVNDPRDYSLTIRLHSDARAVCVLIGAAISVKNRFPYRRSDVGASINPVLAACLARLIPTDLTGRAIDPTCGSGVLLIERLACSAETGGLGVDISARAQSAFAENTAATGFGARFQFLRGDARDPALWKDCSSVLCNLPFGLRVKASPSELRDLYAAVLRNGMAHLQPGGRILLASAFKSGLEAAVTALEGQARLLARCRAEMGGLFYQIVVMGKM